MLDEYVIAVEDKRLYSRIKAAKQIMESKGELVKIAEEDLRKSRNIYDLIYGVRLNRLLTVPERSISDPNLFGHI